MRKITVFNTQSNTPSSFESAATTYGEIKAQIPGADKMKVVVRETKVTLESADALLPEGDFTLFLFPEKVKSGIDFSEYNEDFDGVLQAMDDSQNETAAKLQALDSKLNRVLTTLATIAGTLTLAPGDREKAAKAAEEAAKLANEAANFQF